MSVHETQSVNSNSISMNQNRAEFLEKFQEKHNSKLSENFNKGRWNSLYNQSKLRKMKEEEYRKKQIEKREKELYSECTFSPVLNKNSKYSKHNYLMTYQSAPEKNNYNYQPDITTRQNTWVQKKILHIEALKQNETNKELEQCFFKPETNPHEKLELNKNFYSGAEDILEDPESYSLYVKRQQNKRKSEESKSQRERSVPGSGYLWNPKPKKYNFNYDYTKHEISSRGFPQSKSRKSVNKSTTPSKFNLKPAKSSKQFHIDKDQFYDYLYTAKRNETEISPQSTSNNFNQNQIKLFTFDREIEFGKALETLHNELYSFKLMSDE